MARRGIYRFETASESQLLSAHFHTVHLLFSEVVPEVRHGIPAIADELRLCLSAVVFLAIDVGQY